MKIHQAREAAMANLEEASYKMIRNSDYEGARKLIDNAARLIDEALESGKAGRNE
jgi:hypothetical protein